MAAGEKPLWKEYMTALKGVAENTTMEQYGHNLGLLTMVVDSVCMLCKGGGGGMCLHCSQSLFMQLQHWAEGRPVEKTKRNGVVPMD